MPRSKATQNHWLSEQIFDWSGVPTTNLRVTFFMEWLTYIAELIRYGRYVMPFDADSRFAPIAGRDIALTAATILAKPEEHGGRTYTLTGPVEYSHQELAAEVSRVLAKDLPFEQVTVTTFLDLIGIPDDTAKLRHFEAVTIDQREGRLAGVSDAGPNNHWATPQSRSRSSSTNTARCSTSTTPRQPSDDVGLHVTQARVSSNNGITRLVLAW